MSHPTITHPKWCDPRACLADDNGTGPHASVEHHVLGRSLGARDVSVSFQLRKWPSASTRLYEIVRVGPNDKSVTSIGLSLGQAAGMNATLTSLLVRAEGQ